MTKKFNGLMGTLPCVFDEQDVAQINTWYAQFRRGDPLTPAAPVLARFNFKRPSLFTHDDIRHVLENLHRGPPQVDTIESTELMLDGRGSGKMVVKFKDVLPPPLVPLSDENGELIRYAFCMADEILPEKCGFLHFENLEPGNYYIGTCHFILHRKGFLLDTDELEGMFVTPPSHSGQRFRHPAKLFAKLTAP